MAVFWPIWLPQYLEKHQFSPLDNFMNSASSTHARPKLGTLRTSIGRSVIGLLALMSYASSTYADTLQYYRHMVFRESPMENLRGRHEVNAEQAKTSLHHRFRLDEKGRTIEVSRMVGDKLTRNIGSFEGFFWWAPQVRIEYTADREIRSFYNEAGERIAAHGPVWRMEFKLDAQGRRSSLHYFDKNDKAVDGYWGIHRYEWTYPEPGVVIENRYKQNGEPAPLRPDFLFQRVRMEFGHDDLLDMMLNIDANGKLVATNSGSAVDRIVYDPWLNFVRWQVYDTERRPRNGNAPMLAIGEHVYDGLGQARMLRGFGEQGEDRALADMEGPMTFEYDERGNQTRQQSRNMKGELLHEARLSYSADGTRLDWVRYFDGKGRPAMPPGLPPDFAGMVAQQLQYDARGLRTQAIRYNAEGKPLAPPPAPAPAPAS